jgi:putative oxidoreductase
METLKINIQSIEKPARFLLGAIFLFSSLNYFFDLLKMPEMSMAAHLFFSSIVKTNYLMGVIKSIEFVVAILFLINRYVFQATLLILPIIINIFLFHLFLDLPGLALAVVLVILVLVIALSKKNRYLDLFKEE